VIVRVLGGDGQYKLADEVARDLNELDNEATNAVEAGDEPKLRELLEQMAECVHKRGERLPDDDLSASDLLIPPSDLSLEEARELFSGDGLIPDLPE
jgi:hypothetical protein